MKKKKKKENLYDNQIYTQQRQCGISRAVNGKSNWRVEKQVTFKLWIV